MRNFIGNFLIAFAEFISFSRKMLLFFLILIIWLGIMMITLISLFELLLHIHPKDHIELQIILFKNPIWDIIVLIIVGGTLWVGISKYLGSNNQKSYLK